MSDFYIHRHLRIGNERVSENEALERGSVLVVLAEPGAGKTKLLEQFGRIWEVQIQEASLFRYQTQFSAGQPLIIDSIDEAAKIDQSAVDHIIVKARDHSNGRVIFASRSSEWDTSRTKRISDYFRVEPVIVRIEHLSVDEQQRLFEHDRPGESFSAFAAKCDRFDLSPLLGNPEFLLLFAAAYIQNERHFTSKAQIFNDALERLALEFSERKTTNRRPPTADIIATASEVMAKLLLAGASGVSTQERLAEFGYPYLQSLASGHVDTAMAALDTKLFRPAANPGQHRPMHRIVAEHAAARYIVQRVLDRQNPLSSRRVLAVIAPNGIVRDELRGLLGWMASVGPQPLQQLVIKLDPYAVLANGDPSRLAPVSKKLLLEELAVLSKMNPGFRRGDYWRRFSVAGFFTEDLAEDVGRILHLPEANPGLTNLLLELLVNSGGPESLAVDIRSILLDRAADEQTRVWAGRALWKLTSGDLPSDFRTLIAEASDVSLQIAADLLQGAGARSFTDGDIQLFFKTYAESYSPKRPRRGQQGRMASFHLREGIEQLTAEDVAGHLDRLTAGLSCSCGEDDYECVCREGVSKVAGRLLDHYFSVADTPHDPDRLWAWLRSLRYSHRIDEKTSPAIKAIQDDPVLRHELHQRFFEGVEDGRVALARRWRLDDGHLHEGLAFRADDVPRMVDHAFATSNPGLWSSFVCGFRHGNASAQSNALRRHMRKQALSNPVFGVKWATEHRRFKKIVDDERRRYKRRQRKRVKRKGLREDAWRKDLSDNRQAIEYGSRLDWSHKFASLYLSNREGLTFYSDDLPFVESILLNSLPNLSAHMGSLSQMGMGEGTGYAELAFASCWIHFRVGGSLTHVERSTLAGAKVASRQYDWMDDVAYHSFERELDQLLFPQPKDAETFIRSLFEPGLAAGSSPAWLASWWFSKPFLQNLRETLPLTWLQTYPTMPAQIRHDVFDLAAMSGDRKALLRVIDDGVEAALNGKAIPPHNEETDWGAPRDDLGFWRLRKFFFAPDGTPGLQGVIDGPNSIYKIEEMAGRYTGLREGWPDLSAEKIYCILDSFVDLWPRVDLPSSSGSGDPPNERAYRFLTDVVWRIGHDEPSRSLAVIGKMLASNRFEDFREALLTQRAESTKKQLHYGFEPPSPREIAALFDCAKFASVEDLRAFTVEELEAVQSWVRTEETDPLVTFHRNEKGEHADENTIRNRIVDRLRIRMAGTNLATDIEYHMAGGNRCDFTVAATLDGTRRLLVVEAKGQWHPALFTAAATQLSEQYASHPDAEGQGIYLVFWFGSSISVAGRAKHGVTSADELRTRIVNQMRPALRSLIDVVVLDFSPAPGRLTPPGRS